MEKASWKIHWTEYGSNAYLYGSEIKFKENHVVEFKNELMPPGTVVKEWFSKTNYQGSRIEPSLPIIDGESYYRIRVNVYTPNDKGCLIRLVFYDKYEREAGDVFIRDKVKDFTCPLKTYSYRMQLINGGMTEFVFHSVTIEEIDPPVTEDGEDSKITKRAQKRARKGKTL